MDANGDGTVSRDEYIAYRKKFEEGQDVPVADGEEGEDVTALARRGIEAVQRSKKEIAQREKLLKQLAKVDKKLAKIHANLESMQTAAGEGQVNDALLAFVVFNSPETRDDWLQHYLANGTGWFKFLFPSRLGDEFVLRPETDRVRLSMHIPPEPSAIMWENLEIGWVSRGLRKAASVFMTLLILVLSFVFIVYAKGMQASQAMSANTCNTLEKAAQCNALFDWKNADVRREWGVVSDTSVTPLHVEMGALANTSSFFNSDKCRKDSSGGWLAPSAVAGKEGCVDSATVTEFQWGALMKGFPAGDVSEDLIKECNVCVCTALMNSGEKGALLWAQSYSLGPVEAKFQYEHKDVETAPCSQQAYDLFAFYGFQVGAAVAVGLINALLQATVVFCSGMESHHTIDNQEISTSTGVFLGQFFNTALVALVVNADIQLVSDSLSPEMQSYFPLFAGAYADFTEKWYETVGVQIMTTVLVNVILPIVPLLIALVAKCLAPLRARCVATQPELNAIYKGSQFSLAPRYGMLQTCAFTCFLYSR